MFFERHSPIKELTSAPQNIIVIQKYNQINANTSVAKLPYILEKFGELLTYNE